MPINTPNQQLALFRSLFKGREDVFAIRWGKEGKSGYMPTYSFDPYRYKAHRMKGGTFNNFEEKKYQPLTDEQISKHLNGDQAIGIYPLLPDNTSWFITADFDEANWERECAKFMEQCEASSIPAYLERSRSGKGGHIWIFFEKPYPAFKSRRVIISLLEQSGIFSIFDKHSSFDRLFPNQDYLSGKGLGNLIALPFNKPLMEVGNNCFIHPGTFESYDDQWNFLKSIQKISIEKLDLLFSTKHQGPQAESHEKHEQKEQVGLQLSNALVIDRSFLPVTLINFLKEELNFVNTEYFVKKNSGKNTWNTKRYFKLIEETDEHIVVPRGFTGKLIRFCREKGIEHHFTDARLKLNPVSFTSDITLRPYQTPALEATSKKDLGVIVAPPGSGKTIVGLSIIAKKSLPALIIVHRKQLADQWMDRIESFLGIPKREIGKIGQGKNTIGKQITVAMIQSLEKLVESKQDTELLKSFGTIILDECHHVPAESFSRTISKFNSYYLYGLTATPFRKYNDGKLIFIYLGDIISEIKPQEIETTPGAKIIVRNTELQIPFNSKTDKFETLSKVLVHDSARNQLILNDIISELENGKKVVVVTERKEHIDTLNQYLKQRYEVITLSGEDSDSSKLNKWRILKEGNYQVLITTGQYFGEGSDLQGVECLFLVYPFSFEGKLIQYIGRVQRSEIKPTVYDYRDYQIGYLEKLFQKRNAFYKQLYLHGSLFDQPEKDGMSGKDTFVYEQRISFPIDQLEFNYGKIRFKHTVSDNNQEVAFEVENSEIRPEFNVLKAYFAKVLKSKTAKIDVLAKFLNGVPITISASSNDLNKINREIIDSVKFQFVAKGIIGRVPVDKENLLDLKSIQGQNQPQLFQSEQELLDDLLKNKKVKHYRQLVYLSKRHESHILKLRFVLSPFSFVFLLSGDRQYHIVWETLNSEEATYIWHTPKNLTALKHKLKQIDADISKIRENGRQAYVERQPENFSRIVHDYSDNQKGFVIWKDFLEEKFV